MEEMIVIKIQYGMKRLVDVIGSFLILILLSPILGIISLYISLESEGGVLFTQPRVGRGCRSFRIYKFRTMRPYKIDYRNLKEVGPADPFVTKSGCFLRRFGIDELPQLWNILRGDMSFIGPRPTIKEQVDLYTLFQLRRLEARPGLTGLAQVSGNNSLPWSERIKFDIWYIDHWSLWLDFLIFIRTIKVLLLGQVVGQPVTHASFLPSQEDMNQYARLVEMKLQKTV